MTEEEMRWLRRNAQVNLKYGEDLKIRSEIAKCLIDEWLECPQHVDDAHSVNTYPFANVLRETYMYKFCRFVLGLNWGMIFGVLFLAAVWSVVVWRICRAHAGW